MPWPTILYTLMLDEIMIITGLVGALVASSYKWGYFVISMFALFGIFYNVVFVARNHARVLGSVVSRTFLLCGVWTMGLWFIYPIAWGVSEGGNVISPDSEAVFYGVLDIMAKPVFGALLLWGHRNIDPATLGMAIRDYEDPIDRSERSEKATRGAHHGLGGTETGVTGNNGVAHDGVTGPAGTTNTTTV